MGGLGQAHVEAEVGLPVLLEFGGVVHLVAHEHERVEVSRLRALGGADRDACLDREPVVQECTQLVLREDAARARRKREWVGDERATAPTARCRDQAALRQCRESLTECRPGDLELASELALRRQLATRREEPELDRSRQPLDRLLERRGRLNGLEQRSELIAGSRQGEIRLTGQTIAAPPPAPEVRPQSLGSTADPPLQMHRGWPY